MTSSANFPIPPWLGAGGILLVFGTVMVALVVVKRRVIMHPEVPRKCAHVTMGLATLPIPWLFDSFRPALVVAILAIVSLLFLRLAERRKNDLGYILYWSAQRRKSFGDLLFPVSVFIVFCLAGLDPVLYCLPILYLTFSDPIACLVGMHFSPRSFAGEHKESTIEGSIAFFLTTFACTVAVLVATARTDVTTSIQIALIAGALLSVIEAMSGMGLDNLTVPLAGYLVLYGTLSMEPLPLFVLANLVTGGACAYYAQPYLTARVTCPIGEMAGFTPVTFSVPMSKVVFAATTFDAVQDFAVDSAIPPLDEGKWKQDHPDIHLMITDRQDRLQARCSLWWSGAPRHPGHRVGVIGHYAAGNDAAAAALLQDACLRLAKHSCDYLVGPLDGSTWRSYRFVTDPGHEPPFLLEPVNPPEYPRQFRAAGFGTLASYISARRSGSIPSDPRTDAAARRLEDMGISIAPLDLTHLEDELRAVYCGSQIMFRDSFLFSPISEEEFMALYRSIIPLVEPETFLLAKQEGELVGFAFGVPDHLQSQRGEDVDTLIIKTLARRPETEYAGLGDVLDKRCEAAGCEKLGLPRAIHALMNVDSPSVTLSRRFATTIRGYTLFGKDLTR